MLRDIVQFQRNFYDILVVGGGINGAAIAHVAAQRGLKVALLEKGDFASGTSSKSTKLIHGGIRYLENLEFDLVYESLRERSIQLQVAPHLVKPLKLMIPVYRGDVRPLWMMRLGVFLYDLLAGSRKIATHRKLSAKEVSELEPGMKKDGLRGGVTYWDAQMDDARLCLENALSAAQHGAHVANYVGVLSFIKEDGKVVGVKAHDLLSDQTFEVRARKTVCAVGPWTNELLRIDDPYAKKKVRTTKGIHIIYEGKISNHALLVTSKRDGRVFFIIPWMGNSLIGTTDTNYIGSADHVEANQGDVGYLVNETKRLFPHLNFREDRIITVFAGLRPLIRRGGSPTRVSRKHLFHETISGILFVVGGKYTTYRKIAEECVNRIRKGLPGEDFRLYGSGHIPEKPEMVAARYELDADIVQALMDKYGTRYREVLRLVDENPSLKEKISDSPPVILAQVHYSVKVEVAQTAEDVIVRRLGLGYVGSISEKCENAVRQVIDTLGG